MGTFRRQERALWFLFGVVVGGGIVVAFYTVFEAKRTKI